MLRPGGRMLAYGKKTGAAMCIALLCLGGCSLAPKYERPALPVENTWNQNYLDKKNFSASRLTADIGWKIFFADKPLQHLISLALENNRDFRVSALNIERAKALYQIQRADQLPNVNLTGDATAQNTPAVLSNSGQRMVTHQYSVGPSLSWELDFFGRIQSLKDAALEEYFATEEALKSTQISLVAEIASAYLTLVADRERLSLARDTLKSQQSSYKMIKSRQEMGVSSELDLWQAQTSVDTARVDIARYTSQVAQDITAISLLVGTTITPDLLPAQTINELIMSADLPVGLPSEVLLRRPDIVQAEHLLRSANANIGAARASFFPSISLTAFAGTAGPGLSDLFDGGTGMWRFAPQINLPIFSGGRLTANLRVSETDKKIAVANYEKAIQSAFREISDALIMRKALARERSAQESLTHAASQSYSLSRERYNQGIDSYLNVLDSQRFMYSSQMNLVTVRANQELNKILIYKTLGGGWTAETMPAAATAGQEKTKEIPNSEKIKPLKN